MQASAALAVGLVGSRGAASSAGATVGRAPGGVAQPEPPTNPYLVGNFAPVREELTVADLLVEGSIPRELRGTLLRIGPNPIAPEPSRYHWFLGDGMAHAITLEDGRAAEYRNRWVRTDTAAARLGESPIAGQPPEVNAIPNMANTSLVAHADRILALYEVCGPTAIGRDLATTGRYDFGGRLRSPMTAHPKVDPVTTELFFFGLNIFGPPYLRFHVVDGAGSLMRTHELELPGPAMMHDFAITERNAVFLDLPVVYDLSLVGRRPLPAAWKPDYGARVGVMPRDATAGVRWFEVEPCYVFHTVNAYDDDDRVVLDVVRHSKMFDRDIYGVADGSGTLERWTIDTQTGRVREERVSDRTQELPRVDPRVVGRKHRYGYTQLVSHRDDDIAPRGLLKHDLRSGHSQTARLGRGAAASEGVFVPSAEGAGEDEGWVLSVVYDRSRDRSNLVIIDATQFASRPVARVRLPQRVPFGFHGVWVPADAPA